MSFLRKSSSIGFISHFGFPNNLILKHFKHLQKQNRLKYENYIKLRFYSHKIDDNDPEVNKPKYKRLTNGQIDFKRLNIVSNYVKEFMDVNGPIWENMEKELIKDILFINKDSFPSFIMRHCRSVNNFELANSFMNYLRKKGKMNVRILIIYMAICSNLNKESEMLEALKDIQHSPDELNKSIFGSIIILLSSTNHWLKGLDILKQNKLKCNYVQLVTAAFKANNMKIGLTLAEEFMQNPLNTFSQEALESWIKAATNPSQNIVESLSILISKMRKYDRPAIWWKDSVDLLKFQSESHLPMTGVFTTIDEHCPICHHALEPLDVTHDEFKLLQNEMNITLKGSNIYINTNPKEITRFYDFLKQTKPFDIVVDGLNIAYRSKFSTVSNSFKAEMLLNVIQELTQVQKKKVLLIGRSHMKQWKNPIMKKIFSLTQWFLTENISEDDPFILSAAVHGGPKTEILSCDLLRNHYFNFHNKPEVQNIFLRWKQSRQIHLIGFSKQHHYQQPQKIISRCQGSFETGWHIPYQITEQGAFEIHRHWLCLQPNKTREN